MVKNGLENDNKMEMMVPDNRPCFFKIMYGGLNAEKLRIPSCFVKQISKDLPDTATLKGPSGSCWNVKLSYSKGAMYLQSGWQEFLRDNSLGDNEFLLFLYDGNMCFSVQIFDKSGCEREDIYISPKQQESALPNGKRKRGRPRKTPIPSKSCEDGSGQHFPCHESSELKKFIEEIDIQGKIKAEEIDLPTPEMGPQLVKIKEEKDIEMEIEMEELDLPTPEMDAQTGHSTSGVQSSSKEEKSRAWKEAESFTSDKPYFISCLKKACVHKVLIFTLPMSFSKAHFPQIRTKMVLRNLKGKDWEVNCIPTAGKHFFCAGWPAFVHGNNLKQDDVCIFELVDKNEMQVHIFPE
ncbi:hypothetical protein L1049_015456 [Liquidambar formosana]|uniref:TF-B3 domain-containing protein n=1 Tax=Liquidambar formosana TaxID=63359 RepID=A0AAP0X1W5_LIQFO